MATQLNLNVRVETLSCTASRLPPCQIIHQFPRDFKTYRNKVRILLKEVTPDTFPVPNHTRHEWARWDVFVLISDPDVLFAEFESCGLAFHERLADTEDGLLAFELKNYDGYVLCFGNYFEPN